MRNLAILTMIFITASGCDFSTSNNTNHDSNRDVNWYLSHPEEHSKQLDLCQSNPAKYDSTPDCINARAAASEKAMGYGKFSPNK